MNPTEQERNRQATIRTAERLLASHDERGKVTIDIERYRDIVHAATATQKELKGALRRARIAYRVLQRQDEYVAELEGRSPTPTPRSPEWQHIEAVAAVLEDTARKLGAWWDEHRDLLKP